MSTNFARRNEYRTDDALDISFATSDSSPAAIPTDSAAIGEATPPLVEVDLYRIIAGASRQAPFGPKTPWPERYWASPETGLIRLASSLPMAILEFIADAAGPMPESLLILRVRLSSERITKLSEYPLGWNALPYRASIRGTGDGWAERQTGLALQVPSAVCPGEYSILLNPQHPDAIGLSTYDLRSFRLDPRLLK